MWIEITKDNTRINGVLYNKGEKINVSQSIRDNKVNLKEAKDAGEKAPAEKKAPAAKKTAPKKKAK